MSSVTALSAKKKKTVPLLPILLVLSSSCRNVRFLSWLNVEDSAITPLSPISLIQRCNYRKERFIR